MSNFYVFFRIHFPFKKKAYVIGTPEYSNLGDSSIAIAEKLFLKKCGYKNRCIIEITQSEFTEFSGYYRRFISKKSLLCGIGGGNLGNLWYGEELFRYSFIDTFPDNPIIIFPQTIFFTDDENGRKAKKDSLAHYENHRNLTLVAREKHSFETLNELYHSPKKLLIPDIVLSTTMSDYGVYVKNRSGVLLVFRSDFEKAMTDDEQNSIKDYLSKNALSYRETDMYSDEPVTKENRLELVRKKMQEFADAELVITDRLHGMIFAAITCTPCIVFGNNHYKIQGSYDWLKHLNYVKYFDSIEKATESILFLYNKKDCYLDTKNIMNSYSELEQSISSINN